MIRPHIVILYQRCRLAVDGLGLLREGPFGVTVLTLAYVYTVGSSLTAVRHVERVYRQMDRCILFIFRIPFVLFFIVKVCAKNFGCPSER